MRRRVFVLIVVVLAGAVAVAPAQAAHSASIQYSTASDFQSGSFSNAEVVRSGEAGAVSHGQHASSAVARYAMDSGSGSTAYDSVGSNDGTITGATWEPGIRGQSLEFNGDNDFVDIGSGSGLDGAQSFTVSAWVRPSEQSSAAETIIGKEQTYKVRLKGGQIDFVTADADGWGGDSVTTAPAPSTDEWHHIVAVFDGGAGVKRLYVDGTQVASQSISTGSLQANDRQELIGGIEYFDGSIVNHFHGRIDEARRYSGVLSDAQAQSLYNNPTAKLGTQGTTSSYTSAARNVPSSTGGSVNLSMLNTEATVTWEGSTDGGSTWQTLSQATYTTSGVHSQSWSEFSGDYVRSRVEFNTTSSDHYARLLSESIEYQAAAPAIDDATASPDSSTETASSLPVELSVNISDANFGTPQGDELTANWYIDGQQRTTTTITSSGRASADIQNLDAGVHTWSVEVTDQQGHTVTSDTFEVAVPGELEVYNEAKPNQIVDNTTLRVRVFDGTSDTVVEREVTDGTVDFSGLPATGRFIVTVDGDENKFNYRRIVVSSLVEQQEIYLLPTDVTSADITFRLDDATGAFPSEETRLFIERPINKDFDGDGTNETQYQVISGDNFGAAQDFPTTLETGERYRLRIENNDGDVRVLGSYTATGDAAEVLEIGSVTISGEADDGATATARIIGDGSDRSVRVIYDDAENRTESLQIAIHRQGNESATLIEPETIDGMNSFVGTYPIPDDAPEDVAYEVDVEADRGEATYSTTKYVGELPELIGRFNVDPAIAGLIGWVAITSLGGLVVIYNARLGAVMMVVTAGFTTVVGATQIPTAALALAGSVAVVFLVAGRDGSPV